MPNLREKKVVVKGIIVIIFFIIITGAISLHNVYKNQQGYREKLIRFHVRANSDSPEDQELKLKVRDEIIREMNEKFKDSSSLNESRRIIKRNLEQIESIAKTELKNQGSTFDVRVDYGKYNFPTKSYGNFTLPAGEYEAVNVIIGEGKGENWWCVMFPPLCFVDITNGLTNHKTQEELKDVLTQEEYNMITQAKKEEAVPLKLKFKVVEILEKGKNSVAKLFISLK